MLGDLGVAMLMFPSTRYNGTTGELNGLRTSSKKKKTGHKL